MPRQAIFILVGPRQDQTIELGGYRFVEGECRVRDAELAQCVLRYHSAYESDLVEILPGGVYALRSTLPKATPAQNPPSKDKPPSGSGKKAKEN